MTGTATGAAEESPCVGVCALDEAGERCLGCHRTLSEIAAWPRMTVDARRRLRAELVGRAALAEPGAAGEET